MNQNLAIDIDYGFKEDYVVLFEIYDQDPIEVNDKDGSWKKKDIEPFYRAATSKKGTFNEDGITIRADISEVWLLAKTTVFLSTKMSIFNLYSQKHQHPSAEE